ncbi:extensin family protein [Lutimaribacter marinistellae]|uniref:Extensin family protein n=1 Tax=Lutimaribacter marinistellae TaxID=1820329 RepID=A0ABV7TN50_9RHOB
MRRALVTALTLCLIGGASAATAPERSLRPVERPAPSSMTNADAAVAEAAVAVAISEVTNGMRPKVRPPSPQVTQAALRAPAPGSGQGPDTSLRPPPRTEEAEKAFLFRKRKQRKGSVCDNIEIQGEKVGNVPGSGACGITDAVRVTSVAGVKLSRPALMNCATAHALHTWTTRTLKPTFRRRGPVVEMRVAAHYACRTRNNRKGARLSEHAKGNAIDLSAFTMMDGEVITVLEGWRRGSSRRLLQSAWKGACGPFGTVLGPNADRYHRDHFHFDTARHRSGPYCR